MEIDVNVIAPGFVGICYFFLHTLYRIRQMLAADCPESIFETRSSNYKKIMVLSVENITAENDGNADERLSLHGSVIALL